MRKYLDRVLLAERNLRSVDVRVAEEMVIVIMVIFGNDRETGYVTMIFDSVDY